MFDIVLCQRDYKEIKELECDLFQVLEFEDDGQLKDLVNEGNKVLFITYKSSVRPDLFNIYDLPKNGNCEYYYLSKLNFNSEELENNEKFFPKVMDITLCSEYYAASGVFYVDAVDPVGMPHFEKAVMPIVKSYHKKQAYRPAVFLDRDGVLNVDHSYVYKVDDLELKEGAYEFLLNEFNIERLKIVLTNQSGVSKGMFEYEDVVHFNNALNESLQNLIDAFYIAPFEFLKGVGQYKFHSLCRKPHPGMLLEACYDFPIKLSDSYMVGDKMSDDLDFPLVETIHLRGKYELDSDVTIADNFSEVINFATALPKKTK
ncbi:HAD-IIIA family hydrolase [Halobacteriovorax sp.]|uniref:HAD-IIIA family hydrolase n=1 Tax=Halobacteriovorax sp. TaxID=2020862 RepID=UPI003AF2D364